MLAPRAWADADNDGWDPPEDCDDADDGVSPSAAEDGTDRVDEDCDGTPLIRRAFVSSMSPLTYLDFAMGPGVVLSTPLGDDIATFTGGPNGNMHLQGTLHHASGVFTVTVRVKSLTNGVVCSVGVASASSTTSQPIPATGTSALTFGVAPGDEVTDLSVACTGNGTMVLDWLTVQNGAYAQAPMNDIRASATTMGVPGLSGHSLIRTSLDAAGGMGELLFVGSDVGGLGWSEDALTWYTANGTGADWTTAAQYGVWEAFAIDEGNPLVQDVVVLTGGSWSGDGGGLWYTTSLGGVGQTWQPGPPSPEGTIGGTRTYDACVPAQADVEGINDRVAGAGQYILPHPTAALGTVLLVASQDPDAPGLWVWDRSGTANLARPVWDSSLPAGESPGALAMDASGQWILVGYRPIADATLAGTADRSALYVCPADFTAATAPCVAASLETDDAWGGDIRDIEAHPTEEGLFYVADGGRTAALDGEGDVTCSFGESTVLVVTVMGDTMTWSTTVEDTDDRNADDAPDWAADVGTSTYYHQPDQDYYACGEEGEDTLGELVAPSYATGFFHSITALSLDPEGALLFAHYPYPEKRAYGCVRTFRVPTADIAADATPWLPFQGWAYGRVNFKPNFTGAYAGVGRYHSDAREAAVSVVGDVPEHDGFMASEPLLEDWGGAGTQGSTFFPDDGGHSLLVGGNNLWIVPPAVEDAYGVPIESGWDTPSPTSSSDLSLDSVPHYLAWDGNSPVYQSGTSFYMDVCPGCDSGWFGARDVGIAAGLGDYKMMRMYAAGSTGDRPAATRSCETDMLNGTGRTVSVWADPDDEADDGEGWMSVLAQEGANEADPNEDSNRVRGLLYLDDLSGDEWCWDTVQYESTDEQNLAFGLAGSNYMRDEWDDVGYYQADGIYELHCMDSGRKVGDLAEDHPESNYLTDWWFPCDRDPSDQGDSFHLGAQGVGVITSVKALGGGAALLYATPGEFDQNVVGGEGLWLARYEGDSGIAYTQVDLDVQVEFSKEGFACDPTGFYVWSDRVELSILPGSDPDGMVTAVVASQACGILEVTFDASSAAPVATADVLAGPSVCGALDAATLIALDYSGDGRWLLAGGAAGSGACALDRQASSPTWEEAIDPTDLDIGIVTVESHPHLDDTGYIGGYNDGGDVDGVYLLQRRYRPATGEWRWNNRRISTSDLEQRTVKDLAWGVGVASSDLRAEHLYATCSGSSYWDLTLALE